MASLSVEENYIKNRNGSPDSVASSSTANTDTMDIDLAENSLDQLFQALAEETKTGSQKNLSEFEKIQKQIDSLPKIESGLEASMQKASKSGTTQSFIVKINDPVRVIAKSKNSENIDSGSDWFNMKRPELTPELKRDLLILKNRSALDPTRHYKKDKWEIPKFFQTGTIVEGNTEFYSARLAKKNRGKTLAEEILHDDTATDYFKRKYAEIQKVKKSGGKAHFKKLKSKRRGY